MAIFDDTDVNETYGSKDQFNFARKMAEALLKPQSQMNAGMAVLPGSWMYSIPHLLQAVSGAKYRDIAGAGEKKLIDQSFGLGTKGRSTAYGRPAVSDKVPDKNMSVASASATAPVSATTDPSAGIAVPTNYLDEIKKSENEPLATGKIDQDKAVWDIKQHSIGYGSKAKAGEVINKDEAERRFNVDMADAAKKVDGFKPDLDSGTRAALISLTHNTGTAWMASGLGDAVKRGDTNKAKELFLQYNKVSGRTDPGVAARRAREAGWITKVTKEPEERDLIAEGEGANQIDKELNEAPEDPPNIQVPLPINPQAPATPMPSMSDAGSGGKMYLGGPQNGAPEGGQPPTGPVPPAIAASAPQQMAQARQANPLSPRTVQQLRPDNNGMINIPGLGPMPAPSMPALPTREMMRARAALSSDPEQVAKHYDKLREGQTFDYSTGKLTVRPDENGQHQYSFAPNLVIGPGELAAGATPQGQPSFNLTTPGAQDTSGSPNRLSPSRPMESNEGGLETLTRDQAALEANKAAQGTRTEALAKHQAEMVGSIEGSAKQIRGLQAMQGLSESLDLSRSPTKDMVLKAKQIADQFLPKGAADYIFNKEDLSGSELMEKLNMSMAMADTKSITSRGTNFDILTNMQTNPGLVQSKEGTKMIADALEQNRQVELKLARAANKLKPWELDKLPDTIDKIYKENPLVLKYPDGRTIYVRRMEDDKESEDFYNKLKTGDGYLTPGGTVQYKANKNPIVDETDKYRKAN